MDSAGGAKPVDGQCGGGRDIGSAGQILGSASLYN